jgi:hypothetical protein
MMTELTQWFIPYQIERPKYSSALSKKICKDQKTNTIKEILILIKFT